MTAWAIKQSNGSSTTAGAVFDSAPYGWPVKKGSPLAQSLQRALEHLIATGEYKAIAAKWGGFRHDRQTRHQRGDQLRTPRGDQMTKSLFP